MVGAAIAGFAPFLGGMARSTIGVDQLFIYTSALYLANAFLIVYVIRRHFYRDHRLAQEL